MKLTHVNHSSFIYETNEELLLTDPWIFSNAFQGWSQYPYPHSNLVKKIISRNSNLSIVVISHAHDDHLDDIFLSKLTDNVKVVIPKTNNKGFIRRVLKNGIKEKNIIEVDENIKKVGGFSISAIFDGSLSSEDFIFLISNNNDLVIHSNDNWREYKNITLGKIKSICSKLGIINTILMSQVGIADAYPIYYQGISANEKKTIIKDKIKFMCESVLKNCENLDIKNGFAYANQSIFNSNFSNLIDLDFNPYELRENIINNYSGSILQLNPSDQIINGKFIKCQSNLESFLDYRLSNLEKSFREYCNIKNKKTLPVNFKLIQEEINCKNSINILAAGNTWNDILNGRTNVEALITGGMGIISKPKKYNMKEEYLLLSSWAYLYQNKAIENLSINS